jgi:cytidyltransferase-like protein
MKKKVFVSGCFDMLHSGHVEFLRRAAAYGDELYVALGSDKTVYDLKGRAPVNSEGERRFMLQAVNCVHAAFVSSGSGHLDFEPELRALQPDVFVVNEDGNTPAKRRMCEQLGIAYVVLDRTPHEALPPRSTTDLRRVDQMPYRIDLAGGWLDQPFVSKHHPGAVITLSIEPTVEFNERSGMATSTRRTALELWGAKLPVGDPNKTAKILFCCDNPPGTQEVSGAQDAIGIVFAGLARADFCGEYWPRHIEHLQDEGALQFVESALYLLPLGPRSDDYAVLSQTHIDRNSACALARATDQCWEAIQARDLQGFGSAVKASFEAQIAMFPHMVTPSMRELLAEHANEALGWKVSGAGGGGYIILVAERPIPHALRPIARRAWI